MRLPLYIVDKYDFYKSIALADANHQIVVWVSKSEPELAQAFVKFANEKADEVKVA